MDFGVFEIWQSTVGNIGIQGADFLGGKKLRFWRVGISDGEKKSSDFWAFWSCFTDPLRWQELSEHSDSARCIKTQKSHHGTVAKFEGWLETGCCLGAAQLRVAQSIIPSSAVSSRVNLMWVYPPWNQHITNIASANRLSQEESTFPLDPFWSILQALWVLC